jgi:pimeloyl-ACP methyl ester carboxylesterase
MWNAYSSLSDGQTRQAFLRTLRAVVDYRGQAVSAVNRLHLSSGLPTLLIWGDRDRIIPVAHGYAAHDALPGSRLEVLPGVGHFPKSSPLPRWWISLTTSSPRQRQMPTCRIENRDQDRGAARYPP